MVVFFWVDVANFFSQIVFVIFGTNTLGKFLEKNSTNFAMFLGRIHQTFLYQKNYISMYIFKKTIVVVVVVIMGFGRIPMGENWARSFGVSSLSWTFSRWRLKIMRLVSDRYTMRKWRVRCF